MAYGHDTPSSPDYAVRQSGRRYIASSDDDAGDRTRDRKAIAAAAAASVKPSLTSGTQQPRAAASGRTPYDSDADEADPFRAMANEAVGFVGNAPQGKPQHPAAPLPAAGQAAPPGPLPAQAAPVAPAVPAGPVPQHPAAPAGPSQPAPAGPAAPASAPAASQAALASQAASAATAAASAAAPAAAAGGSKSASGKPPLTENDRRRKKVIAMNYAARQGGDDDDSDEGGPNRAMPPPPPKARASAGAGPPQAAAAYSAPAMAPRPRSAAVPQRRALGRFGADDGASSDDSRAPQIASEKLSLRPLSHDKELDGTNEYLAMQHTTTELRADTEDLPSKLAYEQLNTLTDMSKKLQAEIENSKAIFLRRVRLAELALAAKAFKAWKQVWLAANTDLQKLERALRKMMRWALTRGWLKWREVTKQRGIGSWMVNKIRAVNRAGRRRRSFLAWRELTASTHRILISEKNKLAIRMEVIEQCKANAIRLYMNRQRLKALQVAWTTFDVGRGRRERKRQRLRKFILRGLQGTYARCFDRWKELHAELVKVRRVMVAILKGLMARAFRKWFGDVVAPRRRRRVLLARVLGKALHRCQGRAWGKWMEVVQEAREEREAIYRAVKHWLNRCLSSAMEKWGDACRFARVAKRALMRMYLRGMSKAWEQWWAAIELQRYERSEDGHADMRAQMEAIRRENERLRRDNERFVRLIDSGQWSRARVDEISKAGLTLQQERAELARLILALNSGNREWFTPMERNKMLLKGASSLNAVDRAIKSDILDSGKGVNNPDLLYAIDKLSFQKVSVKAPDGSLRVEAVHGALPAFARTQLQEQRSATLHSPLRPSSARSTRDPLRSLTGGHGALDSGRHHPPHDQHPPQTPPSSSLLSSRQRPVSATPRVGGAGAAGGPGGSTPGRVGVTFPEEQTPRGPAAAVAKAPAAAAAAAAPSKDGGAGAGPSAGGATGGAPGGPGGTSQQPPPPAARLSGRAASAAAQAAAPAPVAAPAAAPAAVAAPGATAGVTAGGQGAAGGLPPAQTGGAAATPAGAPTAAPGPAAAPQGGGAATGAPPGTSLPPLGRSSFGRGGAGEGRVPARDAGVNSSQ